MKVSQFLASLAAVSVAGCATIIEGTSQELQVNSNPPGAVCEFTREGAVIARLTTPSAATVKKTKHDITVKCDKPGYQQAVYINRSGLESGAVAGNVAADLLLTAGLSSIIDSASGADNKYEPIINVTLVPLQQPSVPTN